MICPACSSRLTGRIAQTQFFCWDCCIEFTDDSDGETRMFEIDDEGFLVLIEDSGTQAADV